MSEGSRLRETAIEYEGDIAVAEYLMHKYGGAGSQNATPVKIINWVLRMNPAALEQAIDRLDGTNSKDGLDAVYRDVTEQDPADRLDDAWEGEGAHAFCDRRGRLGTHVGDLRKSLRQQIDDMKKLAQQMEKFQGACANAIREHLAGLRDAYINGLADSGAGADEEIRQTAGEMGLEGAGSGSVAGPKGAAAGAALGAVIGAVIGFVEANERQARELTKVRKNGATSGRVFGRSVQELSDSMDALRPSHYGTGMDGRTEYGLIEGGEDARRRNPSVSDKALNGSWE